MYIKQETEKDPITIVITKQEMKRAFSSPVAYNLFSQALMDKLVKYHIELKEKGEEQ